MRTPKTPPDPGEAPLDPGEAHLFRPWVHRSDNTEASSTRLGPSVDQTEAGNADSRIALGVSVLRAQTSACAKADWDRSRLHAGRVAAAGYKHMMLANAGWRL